MYGYPPERASAIAVREVRSHLAGDTTVEGVALVAFDAMMFEILSKAAELARLM